MTELIPVSVVSGWLGSGKTTFLNRILRGDHGRRIAVLVNEIGEVGIDGELLDTEESFVTLDNGCLCCSINEDLPITLAEMAKVGPLDHIVIETTGLADPMPVGMAVAMPETRDIFRLDALITMADCLHVRASAAAHEEVAAQIEHGDLVILTKCDLVSAEDLEAVIHFIGTVNPAAHLLRNDDPAVLDLSLDLRVEDRSWPHEDHLPAGHAAAFDCVSYQCGDQGTIRFAFEEFLRELPGEVIRAKGIVPLDGERGRLVFHRVGERLDISFDHQSDQPGKLVLIGKGLDREALREELDCLFGVL